MQEPQCLTRYQILSICEYALERNNLKTTEKKKILQFILKKK